MSGILSQSYRLPSGYSMPVLGLGTWQLVGTGCERIVKTAIDLGYRHLDTVEHLKANMDMDGWELSEGDVREIDAIDVEAKLVDATYTQCG